MFPIGAATTGWAAIMQGRIVGDAGDTDEQVNLAHHFAEHSRWHLLKRPPKPHLVAGYVKKNALWRNLTFDGFHPELSRQSVRRQTEGGHVMRIELALKTVLPTTLLTERRELMLPQNVPCKSVRVGFGPAFRIRQEVDLTWRLLERLRRLMLLKPFPPGQNLRGRGAKRVPERNHRFLLRLKRSIR